MTMPNLNARPRRTSLLITASAVLVMGIAACDRGNAPAENPTENAETEAAPATADVSGQTADKSDAPAAAASGLTVKQALAGEHRSDKERARDRYRHPAATLQFFEVASDQTVVELWPGGGWYSAVLAPLLRERGKLVAASFPPKDAPGPAYRQRIHASYMDRLTAHPEVYDKIEVLRFGAEGHFSLGPDNSADRVLTFRNTHNWINDDVEQQIYAAAYAVLKPGGIFGVVQHRAEDDADPPSRAKTGYVPEPYVIETAEAAGFEFVASSEINANEKDIKAYPEGVWTLPPSLRLEDKDREKYLAIGESDRMTLKFRKPAE